MPSNVKVTAIAVHDAEVEMRVGITLFGGHAQPLYRLDIVLR